MSTEAIAAIAQLAAVLVGITAILLTIRALKDQLRTQTFIEYTGRYAGIWEDLPAEARSRRDNFDKARLPPEEQVQLMNVVRGYLNLCSEEYWLFQKKRIDRETWAIWKLGITDTVSLPWFRSSWDELKDEYSYYRDFLELMDECFAASHHLTDEKQPTGRAQDSSITRP